MKKRSISNLKSKLVILLTVTLPILLTSCVSAEQFRESRNSGYTLGDAIEGSFYGFIMFLESILIWVVIILPYVLLFLLIFFIIRWFYKRYYNSETYKAKEAKREERRMEQVARYQEYQRNRAQAFGSRQQAQGVNIAQQTQNPDPYTRTYANTRPQPGNPQGHGPNAPRQNVQEQNHGQQGNYGNQGQGGQQTDR